MKELSHENKLGSMPIFKLLLSMSLPAMVSMLVLSMYNIVDSIFIAQVSEKALEAVSIAFPMQTIMIAFALGVGVGTKSIVSRKLGEKNREEADKFAQTGLMMAFFVTAVFMILGTFLPKYFMQIFTQDAEVITMGQGYLMICMICSFGMTIEMIFSKALQATGNMIVPMVSQLIGAVTNIILDPIFIFVFKLNIYGAGIATVLGQIAAMVFSICMAKRNEKHIRVFFKSFKFNWLKFKEIIKIGIPVMTMNAVGGIVVILLNGLIAKYQGAVSVLGIYFKLQSFVFMPVFGLNQGCMPIMAFNYGAGNEKRYKQCFYIAITLSLIIMAFGLVLFQTIPAQLGSIFDLSPDMTELAVKALRALSLCFIPAGINIIVTTGYQAVGYGGTSLIMNLLRQVVLIIPFAYLFDFWMGLDLIWYTYSIADAITLAIFTPYFLVMMRKIFAKRKLINEKLDAADIVGRENLLITEDVAGDVTVGGVNNLEVIQNPANINDSEEIINND